MTNVFILQRKSQGNLQRINQILLLYEHLYVESLCIITNNKKILTMQI